MVLGTGKRDDMKHKVELNQADIAAIIADRFGVAPGAIDFDITAEMQDGPHFSPATVTVEIWSPQPLGPQPRVGDK